jgi:putative ABC transport system permease protein
VSGRFTVCLAAATPARLSQTVNLPLTGGSAGAALGDGRLLIDTNTARADQLSVGSPLTVRFAQTGATTMRVGGIYKPNPLVGSFIVSDSFFRAHFDNPLPAGVLLRTAPGTPPLEQALNRALIPYANVSAKTRAQFESDQKSKVNQEIGLVYVLLALAIVVALIGIVNTLMLSVFERTHEIGLLRAVGMKRRQVRAMIRSEAVIVALVGAAVGIVVGAALGVALASALRNNGVTAVSVPIVSLLVFVILSALLGLAAATWPARRAARLDVLAAIATQ